MNPILIETVVFAVALLVGLVSAIAPAKIVGFVTRGGRKPSYWTGTWAYATPFRARLSGIAVIAISVVVLVGRRV